MGVLCLQCQTAHASLHGWGSFCPAPYINTAARRAGVERYAAARVRQCYYVLCNDEAVFTDGDFLES